MQQPNFNCHGFVIFFKKCGVIARNEALRVTKQSRALRDCFAPLRSAHNNVLFVLWSMDSQLPSSSKNYFRPSIVIKAWTLLSNFF